MSVETARPLLLSKRGGGFTLIELLIAMAVMAIVAVIAIPNYTRYVARARQQDAKVQLAAIRQAEEMYRLQYGAYTNQTALLSGWKDTSGRYTFAITSVIPPDPLNPNTPGFTARATGNVDGDATIDTWTIDQNDDLKPTINDEVG